MRDFENNLKHDLVVETAVITADTDGASVDMQEYRYLAFYATVGESGDTLSGSVYIELELEESNDDSSFTDCADADVTNTVSGNNTGTFAKIDAAAEDQAIYMCEYKGSKRYVRPVVNVTGTHSNGTPIGIMAVRAGYSQLPVSN